MKQRKINNKSQNNGNQYALLKAIKMLGGQVKLAKLCQVCQQTVSAWVKNKNIPPKYALLIEKLTLGEVTRNELRPDIYISNDE